MSAVPEPPPPSPRTAAAGDRFPAVSAGRFRTQLMRIQELLAAEFTSVYLFDHADGVLYAVDQTAARPPYDELWSRIFIEENLPISAAARNGFPHIGEIDSTIRAYSGLDRALAGAGRIACLPLCYQDRIVGLVSAGRCASPLAAEDLLLRLQPIVDDLARVLSGEHDVLLALIARQIVEPRSTPSGEPTRPEPPGPPEPFGDPAQIRAALSCGTFCWLLDSGAMHLDPVAMRITGSSISHTASAAPLLARVHRSDYPLLRRTLDEAVATEGGFALEYRVRRRDGSLGWVEVRGRVIRDASGAPVLIGLLADTTGRPTWLQLASTQVDAMPDGFAVLGQDLRVMYANDTIARMIGLGRAELVGRRVEDILAPLDPQDWKPHFEQAVRTGRQVSFELFIPQASRWYEVRAGVDAGRLAVHVRDVHERRTRADRDRIRSLRRERAAVFAAELGGTLGVDDVIEVFERLLCRLCEADGVAMHVVADGRLRLIAAVGYTPAGLAELRVLDLEDPGPMTDAVLERRVQVYESKEELNARYPFLDGAVENTTTGALVVEPLEYGASCLGLVCVRFDRPRALSEGYLGFIKRMCGLLVQALYRAHRYDDELSLAARLRDTVFDVPLHAVPDLELASEYRSPGLGLSVGGDWFDVIPLSRGRVGLVVGDVEGHDAHAVGGMSMVRTAVRAFAYEGYGPAAILGRVNRLVTELDPDLLATCCYVELNLPEGCARIARAGHPSPVLSTADGTAALIDLPAGLPLGVDPAETYRAVLIPVPDGALLALYSDGLVESRSIAIDLGTERLVDALRHHPGRTVAQLAHDIVERHFDQTALGDDVTLLLARRV